MRTFFRQRENGFTLVELALVLVIIGLLLTTVLRGAELIRSARLKATGNDLLGYYAAVYTYLDRMGRLPGDTDRDGRMDDVNPLTELSAEDIAVPKASPLGPQYEMGWFSGIPTPSGHTAANAIRLRQIPLEYARRLDDQLDDGFSDGIAGNDSGRRSGALRYTVTGDRATLYFLLD